MTNQAVQTSDVDKDRQAAAATRATRTRAFLWAVATLLVSTVLPLEGGRKFLHGSRCRDSVFHNVRSHTEADSTVP